MSSLVIAHAVPLAPRTTLELGGAAEHFFEATSEEALVAALRHAHHESISVTFLAGGSNVIVADEGVRGLVIAPALRGMRTEAHDGRLSMHVRAGEAWDDVVARAISLGASGIECLSGIPGWAGATPIQNVGAYGQEVADVIERVHVIDRQTLIARVLPKEACDFAYRDSRFKRIPDEFVVTAIDLSLRIGAPVRPTYAELDRALPEDADLETIRKTVIALRRKKSMVWGPSDPNRRSAGSFFTNPIVTDSVAARVIEIALENGLIREAKEVPCHAAGEGTKKLAAAWLIERSGFAKGTRAGAIGISTQHTLALVHHGGGSTSELLTFADRVREGVFARFGIELEREPVFLR